MRCAYWATFGCEGNELPRHAEERQTAQRSDDQSADVIDDRNVRAGPQPDGEVDHDDAGGLLHDAPARRPETKPGDGQRTEEPEDRAARTDRHDIGR